MKDFLALARERFSCRNYDPTAFVSDEVVAQVIEAARISPSACNRQPWHFVVVRDEATRRAILAKSRPSFKDAPVVIVACAVPERAWVRPSDRKNHADVDVSIAVQQMTLQAAALGLGTCWVCSFDVEATGRELAIPDGVYPVALLPLGVPAGNADTDSPNHEKRLAMHEICSCEKY